MELFAGTRSISKAFERRGHKAFCVDWDTKFEGIDLYKDVRELTADEYGIPQSRNRTFMVSILDDSGSVEYSFPKAIPITTEMGDFLEPSVNEKFYNDSPKAQALIDRLIYDGKLPTQAFRKCGE